MYANTYNRVRNAFNVQKPRKLKHVCDLLDEGVTNLKQVQRETELSYSTVFAWKKRIDKILTELYASGADEATRDMAPKDTRECLSPIKETPPAPKNPGKKYEKGVPDLTNPQEARTWYQSRLDNASLDARPSEIAQLARARAEITENMAAPKVNLDVQILVGEAGAEAAQQRLAETFHWLLENDKMPDSIKGLLKDAPTLDVPPVTDAEYEEVPHEPVAGELPRGDAPAPADPADDPSGSSEQG